MTRTHELHAWRELAQRRRIVMLRRNKAISAARLKEILPWKMPAALASPATLVSVYPRSSRRFCRSLPKQSRAHRRRGAATPSPIDGAPKRCQGRRRSQRTATAPLERLIIQNASQLPCSARMLHPRIKSGAGLLIIEERAVLARTRRVLEFSERLGRMVCGSGLRRATASAPCGFNKEGHRYA